MIINCEISVTVVTATFSRPESLFDKMHVINSFDHWARGFISQYRKSFAKAQDATKGPTTMIPVPVINHEKNAVAIVSITHRKKETLCW
jgi:hypothetical protein